MWGSRTLLTVSTADRSVLHSAEVAHFQNSSRKSSEELWTQLRMCWQAQYHTSEVWLHRDAMKPLQRYAKAPTTHDSYSSWRTITLPNGQRLSKGCYPKRTGLYPCNPEPPVFLSDKVTSTIAHLINWLSKSHVDRGCTIFLTGSPCPD
jgi:hypothetical protein